MRDLAVVGRLRGGCEAESCRPVLLRGLRNGCAGRLEVKQLAKPENREDERIVYC